MTTLIVYNKEMNDIMKIVKSLEESGLLIKFVTETNQNEAKEQRGGILGILLWALVATLLRNLSKGKDTIRTAKVTIRAGEAMFTVSHNF